MIPRNSVLRFILPGIKAQFFSDGDLEKIFRWVSDRGRPMKE
jgi:hypothetical protein